MNCLVLLSVTTCFQFFLYLFNMIFIADLYIYQEGNGLNFEQTNISYSSTILGQTIKKALIDWKIYKSRYGKYYANSSEENLRLASFLKNKEYIERHNEKHMNGQVTYKLSMNKFADMLSNEENMLVVDYNKNFGMFVESTKVPSHFLSLEKDWHYKIPTSIDWRDFGYVTSAKFQGLCGSCWIFSAVGAIEGAVKRSTGNLISLSEQNIVDCVYSKGCSGRPPEYAYRHVLKLQNGSVASSEQYPYTGRPSECRFNATSMKSGTIKDYVLLPKNESIIKYAVGTIGPVSMAMGIGFDFRFYHSGIYKYDAEHCRCCNHAMLFVGYGTENGLDYWIIKNSFGSDWGENGFIRVVANVNMCGLTGLASYPIA